MTSRSFFFNFQTQYFTDKNLSRCCFISKYIFPAMYALHERSTLIKCISNERAWYRYTGDTGLFFFTCLHSWPYTGARYRTPGRACSFSRVRPKMYDKSRQLIFKFHLKINISMYKLSQGLHKMYFSVWMGSSKRRG